MCLGTVNLSQLSPFVGLPGAQPACGTNNDYSWPAKGGCAKYDGTKYFWGNVPNAPGGTKKCTDANVKTPMVLSKNKTGSGDLVVVFCAPYPWDGVGVHH